MPIYNAHQVELHGTENQKKNIFVLARQNYKIAAYLALTRHATTRVILILNTKAGLSCIRYSLIPYDLHKHIRPLESQLSVRDASSGVVPIVDTIHLLTNVGSRSADVKLYVVERLKAEVILGFDLFDINVEVIRQVKQGIEPTKVTNVQIFYGPQKRS